MSANRERNFGRPSLESPLSNRSRHYVRVYDRDTRKELFAGTSAEVNGESIIIRSPHYGERAFSLRNVNVTGDHPGEIKSSGNNK